MGPKQSTRNNSVIDAMMLEDMTITELDSVKNNLEENALKYTCMDCNLVTVSKESMDIHVKDKHLQNENEEVKFSCTKCKHDFKEVEDFNAHVKSHEVTVHVISAIIEHEENAEDLATLKNLIYCEILDCYNTCLYVNQETSDEETSCHVRQIENNLDD